VDLAAHIRNYYFKNFAKLSAPRQFHFASRLAAWEGSADARKKLTPLQSYLLPGSPKHTFAQLLKKPVGPIYEGAKRMPFFERYPMLHGINIALFRIKHLKDIYGIDLRHVLWELVSRDDLKKLNQALRTDVKATGWLSSFWVNHLYLSELLFGEEFSLDPELLIAASERYDINDVVQLNLNIYFLTHCIIADSNFYLRSPPAHRMPIYIEMLNILDRLIEHGGAKLDAQLEYLVTSRICGRTSPFENIVYKQLPSLLNSDGYLTEPTGQFSDKSSNSLDASEHRNVLYIMSTTEFSPHKNRVKPFVLSD
jgi:hypothetical protein